MVMVPPLGMTVAGVNTTLTAPEVTWLPTVSAATNIIGVTLVAKKPDGYDSVILLPAASAPPAVVVNENVAAAPVLSATRSLPETAKDV